MILFYLVFSLATVDEGVFGLRVWAWMSRAPQNRPIYYVYYRALDHGEHCEI